jgi:hypothetical protein
MALLILRDNIFLNCTCIFHFLRITINKWMHNIFVAGNVTVWPCYMYYVNNEQQLIEYADVLIIEQNRMLVHVGLRCVTSLYIKLKIEQNRML